MPSARPAPGYENTVKRYNQISTTLKAQPDVLRNQVNQTISLIPGPATDGLTYTGDIQGVNFQNVVVKPMMPDWLYRPMYGRPRNLNIPELRRLSDTPTAGMCIKTIIDEVIAVDWNLRMKDPEQTSNEKAIKEVSERLMNPNRNKENLKIILKKIIRDILCVDSGVIAKIYDLSSYENANPNNRLLPLGRRRMLEFYAYDGGTFTINPDKHGILPDQNAYYQYNFHQQGMPIPFARDEIVYMMANPRTNHLYGVSPMELAYDIIRYEVFGVTSGIDHFTRNNIPKGVLSLLDANSDHIKEFKARLEDRVQIRDPLTEEMRWVSSTIPVVNQDVKFTPFQLTPEMMRLLESQQWYIKLIFACFGVTSDELGFTERSNRSTGLVQSEVFRRKAVLPMLDTLEYYINREILPEYGYEDIWFEFIRTDIQSDMRDQKLWDSWLKNGQRTINEWRREHDDLDPVEWGDEPYSGGFGDAGFNGEEEEKNMVRDSEDGG